MSTDKLKDRGAANDPTASDQAPDDDIATPKPSAKNVSDASLAVDDNDDLGGDPYNHTGSHCVLKVGEDV